MQWSIEPTWDKHSASQSLHLRHKNWVHGSCHQVGNWDWTPYQQYEGGWLMSKQVMGTSHPLLRNRRKPPDQYDELQSPWGYVDPHSLSRPSPRPSMLPLVCCQIGSSIPSPLVCHLSHGYTYLLKLAFINYSCFPHTFQPTLLSYCLLQMHVSSNWPLHTPTQLLLIIGLPSEPGQEEQWASDNGLNCPPLILWTLFNWYFGW
jgi:hypothetical protein